MTISPNYAESKTCTSPLDSRTHPQINAHACTYIYIYPHCPFLQVMLRNSTAYADLIARLRRKDVTLFIDTRKCVACGNCRSVIG